MSLQYLKNMSISLKKMPGGRGHKRMQSLTNETRDALITTLNGLSDIAVSLLEDKSIKYILLGYFQSDRLEAEFGIYRQMSGGCYHISVDQILCSTKLRRLKLYNDLECDSSSAHLSHDNNVCCSSSFEDDELLSMDDALLTTADNLLENELASLLFICGYISFKEGLIRQDNEAQTPNEASEFITLVSRGKLRIPPENLVQFLILCYGYFKVNRTNCVNRMVRVFYELYNASLVDFPCAKGICRRLANTFFRSLVNSDDDKLQHQKTKHKVMKLSSAPFS